MICCNAKPFRFAVCTAKEITVLSKKKTRRTAMFLLAALAGLWSVTASAVPSFARQTGMACAACHTMFPELTAFGRQFKLNGYTMQATPQVMNGDEKNPSVQISAIAPLSVMFQASYTDTKGADKAQQGTRSNLQFPEQFSLFYAGEITPHIGAFLQVTHGDNTSGFGMDNSEIRYADHFTVGDKKDLIFGVIANNNPGMSDVWQSTPVWGYPFAGPATYEKPLSWGLGQSVAGVGVYASYESTLYGELTLYKAMGSGGQDTPLTDPFNAVNTSAVAGWAPYWRLAYETTFGDNTLEVGTFGMNTRLYAGVFNAPAPATDTSGPTNNYRDLAIDAQYERPLGNDSVVVRAIFARERVNLDAYRATVDPAQANLSFRTINVNGTYHFGANKSLQLAYITTGGDASNAAALTAGVNTGTHAIVAEGAYYPWENVRLSLQYTAYSKFGGVSDNASDNNTIYVLGWFVF